MTIKLQDEEIATLFTQVTRSDQIALTRLFEWRDDATACKLSYTHALSSSIRGYVCCEQCTNWHYGDETN